MANSSLKNQAISSMKWNALERFSTQGIQFVLTLILARLLLPSDYGTIGMLAIFIEVSRSFIDSGFHAAIVRKKDANESDFGTVFFFNLFIALVFYAILFITAPAISVFFKLSILVPILRVYSLSLIINSMMAVQISMLQRNLDFKALAKRNVSATLLSGLIGVYLAYRGWGVWALVWQNISSSLISLLLICYICRWYPKVFFSKASFLELWGFGSRLLASGLLNTLYKNITSLAIGRFYTPQDLGYYSRGSQFAHLPTHSIDGVLSTVTYPILAKIQDEDKRLISVYGKYIRMSSLAIFFFAALLATLAKPLVLLILTEKWTGAIIFLQLFAFGSMFDHLNTINLNLLKVKGRSDLFLRLEIIKKTISFLILCCAIPLGVLAICISKLIYNEIAIIINTYYTGKLFNYGYIAQFKEFLPYLLKTIIACIPSYFLTLIPIPDILMIILGGSLSTSIYIFLLWKDSSFIELKDLIVARFPALNVISKGRKI